MRTKTLTLTDENGEVLVDENGEELIAQFQLTDYLMSAFGSVLLLHGYKSSGGYNATAKYFILTDENGEHLTDENDEELGAKILVNTNLFHADATRTMTHGG